MVKEVILACAFLFAGCGPAAHPAATSRTDPTSESWYVQTTNDLAGMARQAEAQLRAGKADEAAAIITKGEPLITRLLAVPQPSLAAVSAASDLDELYGRMLLSNGNYGWARLLFQKNLARWKSWTPKTEETEQRRKQAEAEITLCDRKLAE